MSGPTGDGDGANVLDCDELSTRQVNQALRALPPEWTRTVDPTTGAPARVCVVEPDTVLAGGVLTFGPALASGHMTRGAADAWRALESAGWLEPAATG